jgi:formylglycine-generating enzyme required for sulfatase activity
MKLIKLVILGVVFIHALTLHSHAAQDSGKIPEALINMEFVQIPEGCFLMGSPEDESLTFKREVPQRQVCLDGFEMSKTEVTQEQWKAVMGHNPSYFKGDNRPVDMVSWNSVQEFLKKLNAMDNNRHYRLPTEAEWEYACRAGSTSSYSFGDEALQLGEYAWYSDNAARQTRPVAEKKPNAWGLYDMHGNVWEWVQDWYTYRYYENSPTDNPQGPDNGSLKSLRGGNFLNTAESGMTRCAYRGRNRPDLYHVNFGFRLVSFPESMQDLKI